ncbi:MAG: LicD family protein [Spirochaetia bacterium]|nr:LicD family protein [Spirochaetia bacterium]
MFKTLTPEELHKIQFLELKILKEIKRICTKYDIKYFLTGGTLIGTVRHKGFIPWDDDIDIAMLREDYDKFIDVCPQELGEELMICNLHYDKSVGISHSKIVLKNTVFRSVQQRVSGQENGFFVDVLPYDNVPSKKFLATIYFRLFNFMLVLYSKKLGYMNGTTPLRRFVASMMKICFFWVPKEWLRKKILNYPYRLNKKETKYKAYLSGRYGAPREFRSTYLFDGYTELPFEDDKFMVLKEYHAFLTELFGDYMKLPPVEQRVAHQVAELDFGKY